MDEREKLTKEVVEVLDKYIFLGSKATTYPMIQSVVTFILEDRKRIVAPLIKSWGNKTEPYVWDAVEESIKLAGASHGE